MPTPMDNLTEALFRTIDTRMSLSDVLRARIEQAEPIVSERREGREVRPDDGTTPAQ